MRGCSDRSGALGILGARGMSNSGIYSNDGIWGVWVWVMVGEFMVCIDRTYGISRPRVHVLGLNGPLLTGTRNGGK